MYAINFAKIHILVVEVCVKFYRPTDRAHADVLLSATVHVWKNENNSYFVQNLNKLKCIIVIFGT